LLIVLGCDVGGELEGDHFAVMVAGVGEVAVLWFFVPDEDAIPLLAKGALHAIPVNLSLVIAELYVALIAVAVAVVELVEVMIGIAADLVTEAASDDG
jgi:hypothetical protein